MSAHGVTAVPRRSVIRDTHRAPTGERWHDGVVQRPPALQRLKAFDAFRPRVASGHARGGSALGPRLRRRRSRRYDLGTALLWGGGFLVLIAVLFIAANGAQRVFGDDSATAGELPAAHASSLPDLAVAGPPGSAAHAQQLVRTRAEAFADCVFRAGASSVGGAARAAAAAGASGAGSAAVGAAPPAYGACDAGRAIGVDPSEISRRGAHGPIDGRGARSGLGLFTVHGGREAWLLQYDASGTGWGYSFDARGGVEAQCRTVKGRLCWDLENDPAGALFLGDDATVAVLGSVLRAGRTAR